MRFRCRERAGSEPCSWQGGLEILFQSGNEAVGQGGKVVAGALGQIGRVEHGEMQAGSAGRAAAEPSSEG